MSYNRGLEPHILSIETIIQKSEHKSKLLNNIPLDLKRLFIQQIARGGNNNKETKRAPLFNEGVYSHTIEQSRNDPRKRGKMSIPPLPSKQTQTRSLNTSKNNKNNNDQLNKLQTTRTASYTRQGMRAKRPQRKSIDEELTPEQRLSQDFLVNKNKTQVGLILESQNLIKNQNHGLLQKKFSQYQYQFVIPQQNKKNKGFRKVVHNKQKPRVSVSSQKKPQNTASQNSHIKTQSVIQQLELQNSSPNIHTKHLSQAALKSQKQLSYNQKQNKITKRKRIQTTVENIPDFLVPAIQQQKRKISPIKTTSVKGQKFIQLNIQDAIASKKQKVTKQSSCVTNMKKKITYNKVIRRTQQSIDEILEPKIHFVKLIQKDKTNTGFTRKNSQFISKQSKQRATKSRDRIPIFHKVRSKIVNVEQDVKGWDIQEGPQFYDQY